MLGEFQEEQRRKLRSTGIPDSLQVNKIIKKKNVNGAASVKWVIKAAKFWVVANQKEEDVWKEFANFLWKENKGKEKRRKCSMGF